MNSSNTNASINPSAVPVVMASNLTYQPARRLASGYALSVVLVEDEDDDQGE